MALAPQSPQQDLAVMGTGHAKNLQAVLQEESLILSIE